VHVALALDVSGRARRGAMSRLDLYGTILPLDTSATTLGALPPLTPLG
jgi:hypothetical protein